MHCSLCIQPAPIVSAFELLVGEGLIDRRPIDSVRCHFMIFRIQQLVFGYLSDITILCA